VRTIVGTLVQVSALVALAGCGRIGFASGDDTPGGGGDDGGGTVDAEVITAIPLHDDFEGNMLSSIWTFYNDATGSMGTVANGDYVVTLADQKANSYAGLGLFDSYDFTTLAAWIELGAPPPDGLGKSCYFGITGLAMSYAGQGMLQITATGQTTSLTPFDYTAQRWWRIRGAGGTMRCETSPDGIVWTEIVRYPVTSEHLSTGINLGGGTYAAVAGGEQCHYESFTEPP
jgi:hypothetical protein